MKLQDARDKLNDTTLLLGRFRRKAAIGALAASEDPRDLDTLVAALAADHPDAPRILAAFRRFSPEREPDKIAALWVAWSADPRTDLAETLARLGWPEGLPADPKTARVVLATATAEAAPVILEAAAAFARAQPAAHETINDEIYGAWIRSGADAFERLIAEQRRRPSNPTLDALHALVRNDLPRYQGLGDADGALLANAYAMAPEDWRGRIGQTIAGSTDRALIEAHRRALAGEGLTPAQRLANLKAVNDEDGLFEEARHLRLVEALELCERWARSPGRPARSEYAAVVERTVAAYRALGRFEVDPGPALPDGLVDLFDHWRQQKPADSDLRADLQAEDPFQQARGLYLGHERGLVPDAQLAEAAQSAHWPLRLMARLRLPAPPAAEDHVLWVNACAGDAALLRTPIGGSPDDYARHSRRLEQTRGEAAARVRTLLEILCAFQGAFVASGIEVKEIIEAPERTGATFQDAPADVDFG